MKQREPHVKKYQSKNKEYKGKSSTTTRKGTTCVERKYARL